MRFPGSDPAQHGAIVPRNTLHPTLPHCVRVGREVVTTDIPLADNVGSVEFTTHTLSVARE
jgi:hypothetical protein